MMFKDLKTMLSLIGSQCRDLKIGVMWRLQTMYNASCSIFEAFVINNWLEGDYAKVYQNQVGKKSKQQCWLCKNSLLS